MTTLSDVATKIQPKPKVVTTSCASWESRKNKKVFGIVLTLTFPTFGEDERGKLNILKKVGLSTFKEML